MKDDRQECLSSSQGGGPSAGAVFLAGFGLFALLSLAFFSQSLRGDFMFRDAYHEFYPLNVSLGWKGRGPPLWNPSTALGYPLAGSVFPALWYPVNLALRASGLPWSVAEKLYMLFHFALAGAGMALLMQRLGARPAGTFAGATAYVFSGYLVSQHYAQNLLPGHALLPAALGLALSGGAAGLGAFFLGGLLAGAILVGGDPLGFGLAALLGAGAIMVFPEGAAGPGGVGWGRVGSWRSWLRRVTPRLGIFGAAVLLGSAVELFPTLAGLSETARRSGVSFEDATCWSTRPWRLVELFLARPFGDPLSGYWGESITADCFPLPLALSPYLGVWTILAAAGFWRRDGWRDRRGVALFGLAFGFLLVALGRNFPLYRWLFDYVPGASFFRYPEKHLLTMTLALAAAAGLGTDRLFGPGPGEAGPWPRRLLPAAAGLALALAAVAVFKIFGAAIAGRLEPLTRGSLAGASSAAAAGDLERAVVYFLFAAAIGFAIAALVRGRRALAFVPGLFLLVDLFVQNHRLAPTAVGLHDLDSFFAEVIIGRSGFCDPKRKPPCLAPDAGRIFRDPRILAPPDLGYAELRRWERHTLKPNLGVIDGLEYFDGLNVAAPERLRWVQAALLDFSKLPIYSVKFAVVPTQVEPEAGPELAPIERYRGASLVEFAAPFPRAYWIGAARWVNGEFELGEVYRSHDFRRAVLLEAEAGEAVPPPGPGGPGGIVPAASIERGPNWVKVKLASPGPGWVVINDAFRRGWRATVNGQPAKIYRANALVRAVAAPAGACELELMFWPPGLFPGLVLTPLAWAGFLLARLAARLKPRAGAKGRGQISSPSRT